ncbi:MAG: thiolase domain-containing protein [Planctomycetota bacterium]
MRDVAVIGIGMTKCGELWEKSLRTLFVEAALEAMDDAGVDHIDSMYMGCMSSGLFVGQEHLSSLMADYLGVTPVPAVRVESACASGGVAFRMGFIEVASGLADIVLAGGVEKMTDVSGDEATYALAAASDREYEAFHGITFPGLYAMMARAHMHRYGTTREQLAAVAVKNHRHGRLNPRAQFHLDVTVEAVKQSVRVAEPLNLLDCSPITDGAAACVLAPVEVARKLGKHRVVKVTASAMATDTVALHSRPDITELRSVADAALKAYDMAKLTPRDIHLAEVHDCFTIAEIMAIEALGLAEKGQGGRVTEAGETTLGGRLPVNTSGGLKSKGHPVGATGVAQVFEAVEQLRGDAGQRQVRNARRALVQNMGGTGGSCTVHILEVA